MASFNATCQHSTGKSRDNAIKTDSNCGLHEWNSAALPLQITCAVTSRRRHRSTFWYFLKLSIGIEFRHGWRTNYTSATQRKVLEVSYDGKNFDVCNFIPLAKWEIWGRRRKKYYRTNVTDESTTMWHKELVQTHARRLRVVLKHTRTASQRRYGYKNSPQVT